MNSRRSIGTHCLQQRSDYVPVVFGAVLVGLLAFPVSLRLSIPRRIVLTFTSSLCALRLSRKPCLESNVSHICVYGMRCKRTYLPGVSYLHRISTTIT